MPKLREFIIDEQYLTDVPERKEISWLTGNSAEDLVKILKGRDKSVMIGHKDHPEFTKLREELGKLGYIRIERGWWNGDRVLKSFKLNGFIFRKNLGFSCAIAMKGGFEIARKYGSKHGN